MSVPELRPSIIALTESLMLGGASTFLLNLSAGLKESGHGMRVISLYRANDHRDDFARAGVEVEELHSERQICEDRILAGYHQLARWKPEMVLASLGPESFEILRLLPRGVVRIGIIQSHDPGPFRMAARYAPWIDSMVGVSEPISATLREMPEFHSTRIACIPYGIAFDAPARREARLPGETLRVVYVGRLIEEQKRMSRIAALIEDLSSDGTPVHFTIVGSGPEESALRSRLANVAVVTWAGAVPNRQIAAILREQEVFVLLSDYEGLPLSLLEAMGEGVVPVVSDLSTGMRDAVPDGVGVRVPVGDVPAAAAALRALARDPQRTAVLSRAAELHARQRFSARRMADDFLELFAPPREAPLWPETVKVPIPLAQLRPWVFAPFLRPIRRLVKRQGIRQPSALFP